MASFQKTGTAVADLAIAVNRHRTDSDGQRREQVTFFDCAAFGRTAEIASEYLRKGSSVFVEGYFKNDQWVDRNTGKNRSKLVLVIENLQLIGDKSENRQSNRPAAPPARTAPAPQPQTPAGTSAPIPKLPALQPSAPAAHNELDDEPDDIPFRTTIYRDVKKSRLSRRFVQ